MIAGGVPHAIGAGCFLAEIQEPTDYTIRVERTTPSGFSVADALCHQGLGFERMFECFHYEGTDPDSMRAKWFLPRRTVYEDTAGSIAQLVGYVDTPFFAMRELHTNDVLNIAGSAFSGLYVLEGRGVLECGQAALQLCAPEQFFVPAGAGDLTLRAQPGAPLRVLQCFGPQV